MTDYAISRETLDELQTKAIIEMGEKLAALESRLAQAHERIRYLESQVHGGTTQ